MSDPDFPDPAMESEAACLQELLALARVTRPLRNLLADSDLQLPGVEADPWQVWITASEGMPVGCWVTLVETKELNGHRYFTAIPIFTEIDYAGPEDLILPRDVLGFRAALACRLLLAVLPSNLKECRGTLPDVWKGRIAHFLRWLDAAAELPPQGIETGIAYLADAGDIDPSIAFHHALVDRIDHLRRPVLEWLQQARTIIPFAGCHSNSVGRLATAASSAGKHLEETWKIPAYGLCLVLRQEHDRSHISVTIRDEKNQFSQALHGAKVLSSTGEILATIEGFQTRLSVDQIEKGIVLRSAAGAPIRAIPANQEDE